MCTDRVPVNSALQRRFDRFGNGTSWRDIDEVYPEWDWSHTLAHRIHSGKVTQTRPAVYRAVGLEPPEQPNVYAPKEVAEMIAAMPEEQQQETWEIMNQRMKRGVCAVEGCDIVFTAWQPTTRKYCKRHSWATPAGRRWHRQQRKE